MGAVARARSLRRTAMIDGRALIVGLAILAAASGATPAEGQVLPPPQEADAAADKTVLIAGDIAGCEWSADSKTASLIARRPGLVLTAGDNAYPAASLNVLRSCLGPTWGRFKERIRPALGNHDDIRAFSAYFGRKAGPRGRGYYAFDHGSWRVYVLDSNCTLRPRCTAGTPQYRWLRKDLEANPRRCNLAVLHHPVFSSGSHRNSSRTIELIRLLYAAGTDVVVNGHDHIYERFRRAAPWGREDPDHGMRQFIVGTGGAPLYPFRDDRPAHSQVRQNTTHGVLRLTLGQGRYAWRFLPVAGHRFTDVGETECHDPPPPRARGATRDSQSRGSPVVADPSLGLVFDVDQPNRGPTLPSAATRGQYAVQVRSRSRAKPRRAPGRTHAAPSFGRLMFSHGNPTTRSSKPSASKSAPPSVSPK